MDNSHAPIGSPPSGSEQFFIGYLSGYLLQNGLITPQDWVIALRAADGFQRETNARITNDQTI